MIIHDFVLLFRLTVKLFLEVLSIPKIFFAISFLVLVRRRFEVIWKGSLVNVLCYLPVTRSNIIEKAKALIVGQLKRRISSVAIRLRRRFHNVRVR